MLHEYPLADRNNMGVFF